MNNTFCLGIFMALVYFQVDVLRPVLVDSEVHLVGLSIAVLKSCSDPMEGLGLEVYGGDPDHHRC